MVSIDVPHKKSDSEIVARMEFISKRSYPEKIGWESEHYEEKRSERRLEIWGS